MNPDPATELKEELRKLEELMGFLYILRAHIRGLLDELEPSITVPADTKVH